MKKDSKDMLVSPLTVGLLDSEKQLLDKLGALRKIYSQHFDQPWLASIVESLPIDLKDLRDIRLLLNLDYIGINEQTIVEQGILSFRSYISILRSHLLPHLKDKLQISNFSPDHQVQDKSQLLIRKMTYHVLPHNIEELAKCLEDFSNLYQEH